MTDGILERERRTKTAVAGNPAPLQHAALTAHTGRQPELRVHVRGRLVRPREVVVLRSGQMALLVCRLRMPSETGLTRDAQYPCMSLRKYASPYADTWSKMLGFSDRFLEVAMKDPRQ